MNAIDTRKKNLKLSHALNVRGFYINLTQHLIYLKLTKNLNAINNASQHLNRQLLKIKVLDPYPHLL
jgi:hypothetical protein